ncbi:hypothetical protein ISS86_03080 [Candidatus Microgenomates bacterium]|nr:hypothetical protein [Candidatus Microgenomates bacterium]
MKFHEKNISEKVLYVATTLLIIATILLCLNYPFRNSIYLFLLVFGTVFWQRKKLQSFFQKIKNQKIIWVFYILAGWIWMIFFEFQLDRLPFNPKPIANLIIGLGFYLPYFALWFKLVKRYQFNFFEVFYLASFGRLFFDLLITRKLLMPAVFIFNPLFALIAIFARTITTITLFGTLTTLPSLLLPERKSDYQKSLKQYLIGLTPNFLAAGAFIVWAIILKIVFKA